MSATCTFYLYNPPVFGEVKVVNITKVVTRNKPVSMETESHLCKLQVLALSCQPCLNVGHFTHQPSADMQYTQDE